MAKPAATVERRCKMCGNLFQIEEYRVRIGAGTYCDRECSRFGVKIMRDQTGKRQDIRESLLRGRRVVGGGKPPVHH